MNSKTLGYVVIGGVLFYVFLRFKEGKPLLGVSEKAIDSAMPWFGIKNPILREVIKRAANSFTQKNMGEAIDVEFVRMRN